MGVTTLSNQLSNELLAQIYGQQSEDPFLMLLTLTHNDFAGPIRLVNNTVDIVSNGNTYQAFPLKITLPTDDGESSREVSLELDNTTLELMDELRSITTSIDVRLDMILASDPNTIQLSLQELKMKNISYNSSTIRANLLVDNFLNVEMTSEKYTPSNFPGLF